MYRGEEQGTADELGGQRGGNLQLQFRCLLVAALFIWPVMARSDVHASALSHDPMVREAFDHFNVLDYPTCIGLLEKVHTAHPGDPEATALLLEARVFEELYRQDLLDTTFYANDGFLTGKHPTPEDPTARDRIFSLEDEVERESEAHLNKNARDVDALYARGWARSLRSSYVAMVERSFGTAFHMALQAHSDEAKVLQILIMWMPSWSWGRINT
jgi:hypothetical protein